MTDADNNRCEEPALQPLEEYLEVAPNGGSQQSLEKDAEADPKSGAAPATTTASATTEVISEEKEGDTGIPSAMTLDVAYQSLEMVSKVNLQVEFGQEVLDTQCVPCLRAERSANLVQANKGRFGKWMSRKAPVSPCLTCGSPVCKSHRSSEFGKQNIAICLDCAHLFSVNYIVHHITQHPQEQNNNHEFLERKQKINNMLEVYDRALLVLTFSTQFIDEVVISLEANTSRHNIVGLGSSATGVVAGGLGVVAAATIFTPVGPPLLLASILFGSSATAVTAGSEAVNYRCEPNKMADRILTLHSIITCIARLPGVLEMEAEGGEDPLAAPEKEPNQSSLHWTRTAMNVVKPLTAGALSAVSIVTEAREMKNTVEKIRAGNPCDKAERLRTIKQEVVNLPHTDDLSHQLNAITARRKQQQQQPQPPQPEQQQPQLVSDVTSAPETEVPA